MLDDLPVRYRTAVEAGDRQALAALYQPDVLLDANVPNWRFQVQGRKTVAEQACALPRPGRFATFYSERTARGLLVQLEWRQHTADGHTVVRELQAWRLADGRIAEQLIFCAGVWDPQLQARMAAEAPLVRP
ncbi:MAG: nuclear transport factor 2 family protein [Actinomycetota bacterium]|nr:nuclear transport factor 2 family protein [Actinomycetota bacterium]